MQRSFSQHALVNAGSQAFRYCSVFEKDPKSALSEPRAFHPRMTTGLLTSALLLNIIIPQLLIYKNDNLAFSTRPSACEGGVKKMGKLHDSHNFDSRGFA